MLTGLFPFVCMMDHIAKPFIRNCNLKTSEGKEDIFVFVQLPAHEELETDVIELLYHCHPN